MRSRILAADFDGTLFKSAYPNIGDPIWKTIEYCKAHKAGGGILILWTCRTDDALQNAIKACEEVGLIFDYINENTREHICEYGGSDCRKIFADEYIDDKAINVREIL